MRTNCYVYGDGRRDCLLIDPGAEPEAIVSRLEMLNMIPRGIVLTHGHYDHTSSTNNLVAHYKERQIDLTVAVHESDAAYLGRDSETTNRQNFEVLGAEALAFFEMSFTPLPAPDVLLKEADTVFDTELTVMETPGHTPGSICLYSGSDALLFCGDTLFFEGVGRTDLPGGDEAQLAESIRTRIVPLPPETAILPGHGPLSTIEREIKGNPFLRIT